MVQNSIFFLEIRKRKRPENLMFLSHIEGALVAHPRVGGVPLVGDLSMGANGADQRKMVTE